jgi:hypothetical protein
VNGPNIVNSSNVVNCPMVVNCPYKWAECFLRWNLEHFAHLHWRTCTKPVKYQNTNSWFWNCSESVVFFCLFLFFSLSQQLDNLEHSAHLYGQFTTFELLTIFGSFKIFGQFTTYELVTPFGLIPTFLG